MPPSNPNLEHSNVGGSHSPATRAAIRSHFPALGRGTVFFDNAGGSQLPRCAIDAAVACMTDGFAQLGGEYGPSLLARQIVGLAHDVVLAYLNAGAVGEVVLGSSTTSLVNLIASAYADGSRERNQIVLCSANHEGNLSPWLRLASRGFEIRWWHAEQEPSEDARTVIYRPRIETLRGLLSDRTLLVAFPQVSNILGEVWDARGVAAAAHAVGAKVIVDGVAYAPHFAPDVAALGCDWYVYSTYKVYGPHMAALFGTHGAWAELCGPNHGFIDRADTRKKWELGGASHEGCAAIGALWDYCAWLAGAPGSGVPTREVFERAFSVIAELERPLTERMLSYLRSRPGVTIYGPSGASPARVCTVCFTVRGKRSEEIARAANAAGLGVRFGHFYSKRLIEQMGLEPEDGVVRVSLAHYNTPEELDMLFAFLENYGKR